MAAAFPDWLGEDLGTPDLAVALAEDDAPEVVLEGAEELEPARVHNTLPAASSWKWNSPRRWPRAR